MSHGHEAPGRPAGRSGVFVLALALVLPGCEAVGGARGSTIALDSTEITIAGHVHDVRLSGTGATDSLVPSSVQAAPGDAVRFTAADRRPHAPTFVVDALTPEVEDFLERTGQLRGPPLVAQGAQWVVLLEGAPPGRYPFVCRAHDARGEIRVAVED